MVRRVSSREACVVNHYVKIGRQRAVNAFYGLRPTALRGRFAGPRVLVNSIPKAGTHLLGTALRHFPRLRDTTFRTLRGWERVPAETWRGLRSIRDGAFKDAHLPAHPELVAKLPELGIRHVLMIRDPRDVVVSLARYITYDHSDNTHRMHAAFASLADDDERLLAGIRGIPGVNHGIGDVMRRFHGWLGRDDVMVVRFEDLVGAQGAGDSERQLRTIGEIGRFIDIPLSREEVLDIAARTFSTSSPTFAGGRSGGWRKAFKPQHVEAFKTVPGGELIVDYGYAASLDW